MAGPALAGELCLPEGDHVPTVQRRWCADAHTVDQRAIAAAQIYDPIVAADALDDCVPSHVTRWESALSAAVAYRRGG